MRWNATKALDPMAALLAKEEIRDLAHRYHLYSEGGRTAELEELFAADAVMELVWPDRTATFTGRGEVMDIFRRAGETVSGQAATSSGHRYARHHLTTHQIDLQDATSATGRWYFAVIVPAGLDHWGRYLDRYVRDTDGAWRFARRRVQVEGIVPGSSFAP